jgi:hypothetical protein
MIIFSPFLKYASASFKLKNNLYLLALNGFTIRTTNALKIGFGLIL